MGSITSWLRLEPRCRDDDMAQAVQARLYDPLWLLARQWQVGEFEGEDTGSPVLARWRAQTTPLTRFHAGPLAPNSRVAASRYDVAALPLEAMVERQPVRAAGPLDEKRSMRLAVESGLHFLRVLDVQSTSASYRAAFVDHFALAPPTAQQRARTDAQTLSWWELMAGRVPDGRRLALALRGPERNALIDAMQIAPGDRAEVDKALGDWLASHDALVTEPPAGSDERRIAGFFADALSRIEALPGVQSAAGVSFLPLAGPGMATSFPRPLAGSPKPLPPLVTSKPEPPGTATFTKVGFGM